MKNRAYHHGIRCAPYEAMFGQPMKCGLKTSNLPDELVRKLRTEEELESLINTVNSQNANDPDTDTRGGESITVSEPDSSSRVREEESMNGDHTDVPVVRLTDGLLSENDSLVVRQTDQSEIEDEIDGMVLARQVDGSVLSGQMGSTEAGAHEQVDGSLLGGGIDGQEAGAHVQAGGTVLGGQIDGSGAGAHKQADGTVLVGQIDGSEAGQHEQADGTVLGGQIDGTEAGPHEQADGTVLSRRIDGSEAGAHEQADRTVLGGQVDGSEVGPQGDGLEVDENMSDDLEADILHRKWSIKAKRKIANENLKKQASKMLRLSNQKFIPATIGDNVRIQVSEVDRSKCSSRNIIGVVLEIDEEKSLYKIGTDQGVLKNMYCRGEFEICKERFLSVNDVPLTSTSVRECHAKTAITGGQGFFKCDCKTGCKTNRCKCLKANPTRLCNSRCHSSTSCCNK